MTIISKEKPRLITGEERRKLAELARKVNQAAGIDGEVTMTPAEIRRRQIERGIKPEDNIGSRDLMRMRYGDDWDKE